MVKGAFNVKRRKLRGSGPRVADPPPGEAHEYFSSARPPSPPLDAIGLLDALPDGALLVDSARRVVAVNARLAELLGGGGAAAGAAVGAVPEAFAAFARRLALAGEYALIGLGDLVEPAAGDPPPAAREIALASGAPVAVRARRTADGGTLLLFAEPGRGDATDRFAREVLQRLPGAVIRVRLDAAGNAFCVRIGPNGQQFFGMAPERLIREGANLLEFVHPPDRAAMAALFAARVAEPATIDHEFRMVSADGRIMWARCMGMSFRDSTGASHCDLRLMDVAHRVQVARDRRHFERLLNMVVEHLPHVVTVRDVTDGRYVLINRAAHDLLGVNIAELLGKADAGVFPDSLRDLRRPYNARVLETGKPTEFPDLLVDTPGHGRRIIKTTKYPMLDDDGALRYVLSINEDVTERREAQDALQRSEQRLREAIESFSDGLALFDGNDRLVLCNRRYREMWPGIAEIARPGVRYEDVVRAVARSGGLRHQPADPDAYAAARAALHRNPPTTREIALADGRWLHVSDRATAEGGIVVTCTDITALKEREDTLRRTGREALRAKEAAENASRSKSDFLANMSHELRTPLNAVIGFSEIIRDALLGLEPDNIAHYRAYAADIHNSGRHLLALINDILDMSKIEAGKLDLVEEEVDVRAAIEASLALVRERARRSQIALHTACPDNLPRLHGDMRKIKQILINLLSNAVKFTKPGGKVTVEAFVDGGGEYVLRVNDTGIGIRPEDIGKALAPFGQVEDGLARSYEGTGLGLTLTKSLVELHGGRLEIASRCDEPPTGTSVSAIFPPHRVGASAFP